MGFFRSLMLLVVVGGIALMGTTVPIGQYTLFGHLKRIWNAEETRELVRSVAEESGPALERVRRGFEAGVEEAARPTDTVPNPSEAATAPQGTVPGTGQSAQLNKQPSPPEPG